MVKILAELGEKDLLDYAINHIQKKSELVIALIWLAVIDARSGDYESALTRYHEAIDKIQSFQDNFPMDMLLGHTVNILLNRPIEEVLLCKLTFDWTFAEFGTISEHYFLSILDDIKGDTCCKTFLVEHAKKTAAKISEEKVRSEHLAIIAILEAQLGRGKQAVEISEMLLSRKELFLPIIAKALALSGEKEQYMRLLKLALNNSLALYKVYTSIPILYPDQKAEIKSAIKNCLGCSG